MNESGILQSIPLSILGKAIIYDDRKYGEVVFVTGDGEITIMGGLV